MFIHVIHLMWGYHDMDQMTVNKNACIKRKISFEIQESDSGIKKSNFRTNFLLILY